MNASTEDLERTLRRDLDALGERFADEGFSTDLYRALAGAAWRKADGPDGGLALSWSRAEGVVNELRERHGQPPLTLAQTGGEGEVAGVVADELGRLGWAAAPRRTDTHDARHSGQDAAGPPPADDGERGSPAEDSGAWARQAHEEADRN